ncbi:MAG: 3-deoxy-7-phosphoheptulonate synthase [Saccharofermentans sp.]|nr:3-deoxy-7-phosphoheptulonate synthase [Saccharofermentans sp.]
MIAVIKKDATRQQIDNLVNWFSKQGLTVNESQGDYCTVLGLIGDTSGVDIDLLQGLDIIETVTRITDSFKQVNKKFQPEATIVDIGGVKIGGGNFAVIAGPSSVESEEQIMMAAQMAKAGGANILQGGTFKSRTSPYDFQGLHEEGIKLLVQAGKSVNLPVVTEILSVEQLPLFDDVDALQIGARNMQNYELLKALGKSNKPVILKRGQSATIKELLMSAEYIMSEGNENIILCERGIRTYETYTKNTFDISAIPTLKELTHLPVIADPSQATGRANLVKKMAMAAVVAGSDGLEIDIHPNPEQAKSDAAQTITGATFNDVMDAVSKTRSIL